jgi:putative inorganic carbon (hco3(-)) transporter
MPVTLRPLPLNFLSEEGLSAPEALAFIFLIILVILSPIPYGGVTATEELRLVVSALCTGLVALAAGWRRPGAGAAIAIAALLLLALAGLVQVAPLPHSILQQFSPESAHIWQEAQRVLVSAGDESGITPRISIAPRETVRTLLLILACGACFVASFTILRTRLLRRLTLMTFVGTSIVHVGWAAFTQSTEPRLHGTFVNPNNFAAYLEIGLAAAFGLALTEILTGRESIGRTRSRGAMLEHRLMRLIPFTLAWAVLAIGIGMTRSRLGIAASLLTMLTLSAAALLHRSAAAQRTRLSIAIGGVLASATVVAALATREQPLLRFLAADPRDPQSDLRFRLWSLSLDAARKFPHFGSGLGTYRDAFRRVQPADFNGLFEHAHSDYVQILVTSGLIGFCIAAIGVTALAGDMTRRWWHQRHREESAVILATLGALLSLLIHGIAEFNLGIPAIAIALAIVLGAGVAAGEHEKRSQKSEVRIEK